MLVTSIPLANLGYGYFTRWAFLSAGFKKSACIFQVLAAQFLHIFSKCYKLFRGSMPM